MLPIFNKDLNRLELIKYNKIGKKDISTAVHRNHSFELVASVLNAFLSFSDYNAKFLFSDYDDSLTFKYVGADLHIIWLDLSRYHDKNIGNFISEKLAELRSITSAPILFCYLSEKEVNVELPGAVYIINLYNELIQRDIKIYDLEKEFFSGTKLSSQALLESSRILGMKYIPALFNVRVKAIVADLDNTLYSGVLGEDGKELLVPNNKLQAQLKGLLDSGIMLCLCSKNEHNDVVELFNFRNDFLLKFNDFTATQINWNSKRDNIIKLAETMNIGLDSILFIDDNPAEIENVSELPIKTILASDEDSVVQILQNYPGLFRLNFTKEDSLRSNDIKANQERMKLLSEVSLEEYFKKLELKLTITIDKAETLKRATELFNKTNQFIFSYARFSEQEVKEFFEDSDKALLTVRMEDKLSDSGIIAIMACHRNSENQLEIDELVVSCRALGRNIEQIMINELFKLAVAYLKCNDNVLICFKIGERNVPAQNFIKGLLKLASIQNDIQKFSYEISAVETYGLNMEVLD